jgi:hypothetical protein
MIKKILMCLLLFWLVFILSLEVSIIIQDICFDNVTQQHIKTLKTIGFYSIK